MPPSTAKMRRKDDLFLNTTVKPMMEPLHAMVMQHVRSAIGSVLVDSPSMRPVEFDDAVCAALSRAPTRILEEFGYRRKRGVFVHFLPCYPALPAEEVAVDALCKELYWFVYFFYVLCPKASQRVARFKK